MEFKGRLTNAVRTFENDYLLTIKANAEQINEEELNKALNGNFDLKITIKQYRENRSLNANAYFHLLVNKIAEKLNIGNDECKIKMNLEYGTPAVDEVGNQVCVKMPASVDIKQFYDYAKYIGEKVENGLTLNYYVFYKETHTLDTKEMSRLIDGVASEAKTLGIETATPEQLAEMKSLWKTEDGKIK